MYIVKCDRCGKEKQVKNILPIFGVDKPELVQKYMISSFGENGSSTIYLCEECEEEFTAFLKGSVKYFIQNNNSDWLRTKTDEELAEWLSDNDSNFPIGDSRKKWLDWLKQEATDVPIPQQD